jgi:hypothetical protein
MDIKFATGGMAGDTSADVVALPTSQIYLTRPIATSRIAPRGDTGCTQ